MAFKRRHNISATFSMASMTDVIFLLLIFFMVTSTAMFPNAIKVMLPQSKNQVSNTPAARVTIDSDNNFYFSKGNTSPKMISAEELGSLLEQLVAEEGDVFVSVNADESIEYGEVVRVLAAGAEKGVKMVLATRPVKK
ncbi:MAG: biopolymer transporter ExbD [Bacteroidales bacterium]|nr:biopolymer transporter ExbD [Bacteroidales bacterium]MBQ7818820.1 biopolymer transporter ExbD [Bacteroidales bacterium]